MSEESNVPAEAKSKRDISGTDKAAILLLSLGEKDAAEVLKHLGPKEVQRLGLAMTGQSNIAQDDVEIVLDTFFDNFSTETNLGVGSDDYIRNVLVQALGADKAGSVIDRIMMNSNTRGLDTLKWMDSRAVADIIRYEHPQIMAIVLSYIDSDQAAEVLSLLPDKVRSDVMMRIGTLETIQPSALQELNAILEKQFAGSQGSQSSAIGGIKTAAEIMNFLDSNVETDIMDSLKESDEDLSQKIQDLMFVFDNLKDVDDRGIQALLREVSPDNLIVALKGADEDLREKFFKNMSKRAAELLRDDLEAKGPVRISDVEASQKEILGIARRMADAGEINLSSGGDEFV